MAAEDEKGVSQTASNGSRKKKKKKKKKKKGKKKRKKNTRPPRVNLKMTKPDHFSRFVSLCGASQRDRIKKGHKFKKGKAVITPKNQKKKKQSRRGKGITIMSNRGRLKCGQLVLCGGSSVIGKKMTGKGVFKRGWKSSF